MHRRRFIALTGGLVALPGCTHEDEPEERADPGDEDDDGSVDDESEGETEDGGDGSEVDGNQPYTDYQLDVRDERWGAHPVWIDRDGYAYGRGGDRLLGSDDWWKTTEELFTFDEGIVRAVVVPESGRVVVGLEDREGNDGRIEVLDADFDASETAYEFEYGHATHSIGHATYEDIVVIGSYGFSDHEAGDHPNEVILSTDGGETFERVLEAELRTEDATTLHIHDVEYDPYADRIWVTVGDGDNAQIYWSDDLGESWTPIRDRGQVPQLSQVVAFEDSVVFGTDGAPEGIVRWERGGPDDEPDGLGDLDYPHVAIEDEPADRMRMYARRRWHVREDDGRELCLIPFSYAPDHPDWRESVVLGSVDGDEWYELFRIDDEDVFLSNVVGPLSMDGDRRTLVSDSTREDGYLLDATVPAFWE